MNDKNIELKRYEKRAKKLLNKKTFILPYKNPSYLNIPYKYYFSIFKNLNKSSKLLEIGSGIGQNTLQLLEMSFNVCATDISPTSIKIIKKKFSRYKNFSSKIADMENLPFRKNSFDIVCSAGSLSYGNNELVMKEIFRVLKSNGIVVIVDSLNSNFIYGINRYLNYLKGYRSKNTLKRMPNIILINDYIKKFGYGKIKFFGCITWAFPLLNIFLSDSLIVKISNWIDHKLKIKKSAFKFVLILKKLNK
jgi:SAM-dependent methyltransferase